MSEPTRPASLPAERLSAAFDAMTDPVFILQENWTIEQANVAASLALGYSQPDRLGGRRLTEFFKDATLLPDQLQEGVEVELLREDGTTRSYLFSVTTFREHSGPVRGFVVVCRDSSSLRMLQTSIEHGHRLTALGELAASIAHEINTPLGTILGNAQLIRSRMADAAIEDEDIRTFADRIETTALRVARVIRGLRTISRDSETDPFESVQLAGLIQEAVEICTPKLRALSVSIALDWIPEHIQVECRGYQIGQVLVNVLQNSLDALEFRPEKWIRISFAQPEPGLADIFVIDSGLGVPAAIREKIFNPFFSTKPPGKGTGIGLSLSNRLIRAHGGEIQLDTTRVNTCFRIRLPLSQASSGS